MSVEGRNTHIHIKKKIKIFGFIQQIFKHISSSNLLSEGNLINQKQRQQRRKVL